MNSARVSIRRCSAALSILIALLFGGLSEASLIYDANIATQAHGTAVSALGWEAYDASGSDLSNSNNDPVFFVNFGSEGRLLVGDDTDSDNAYALLTNQGVDPDAYLNDLSISYNGFIQDRSIDNSPPLGLRALVQVDSTWYGTDLIEAGSYNTSNVVSDAIWRPWTQTPTNGFTYANTDFGTAGALPGGLIANTGLLVVDVNSGEDDAVDIRAYTIQGTVVPEPATFSMLAVGLLAVGCNGWRRRRQSGPLTGSPIR